MFYIDCTAEIKYKYKYKKKLQLKIMRILQYTFV